MINLQIVDYKVTQNITLKNRQTKVNVDAGKDKVEKELKKLTRQLGDLQNTLYAHGKYAVLVCIQGTDTSGKDSLIREVFKDFNVRGVISHSFKAPNQKELRHNYLWRHYVALPERGKFAVFNRTHYENVLVTRVHPQYILKENIPGIEKVEDINEEFWNKRFDQINEFEKTVAENGTIIFKFFLHLSKDEQKERLLRRLEKKSKNWKFSPDDLKERELWDIYQEYFEDVINKTSNKYAPWYIIPADDKPTARYLVAKTLLEVLESYSDIKEPELPESLQAQIGDYISRLKKS